MQLDSVKEDNFCKCIEILNFLILLIIMKIFTSRAVAQRCNTKMLNLISIGGQHQVLYLFNI